MTLPFKEELLDIAEVIDALRMVPRALLALFGYLSYWFIIEVWEWYKVLPANERTMEATGGATLLVGAVTGLFTKYAVAYAEHKAFITPKLPPASPVKSDEQEGEL